MSKPRLKTLNVRSLFKRLSVTQDLMFTTLLNPLRLYRFKTEIVSSKMWMNVHVHSSTISSDSILPTPGFELAIRISQFAKGFGSLRICFCIFSKNCESLKSDTLWNSTVIHWTSYIVSYFKPIKYALLNNNVSSQRFIVHISPN